MSRAWCARKIGPAWPIVLVLLALSSFAPPASAETGAAANARAVFEAHCARCHQAGKLENPPAKGRLGTILDLDRLLERDDLIVPSDPDASRLYQIMLARHRPLSVFFGPVVGPTAAEIGVVRDWLAGMPPVGLPCTGKPQVTQTDLKRDIAAWRTAFEIDAEKPLRFVSLANLYNLCRSDATIAVYRDAIAALLARLTLRPKVTLDTVGEASVLLAFRPSDLGLTAEAWDLRAGKGEGIAGVVVAEALAARAMAAAPDSTAESGSGAIANPVAASASAATNADIDPAEALALEYTRPVSLQRAAVELGRDEAALRTQLGELTGNEAQMALRLAETGLPRAEWEILRARLTGRQVAQETAAAAPLPASDGLRLDLWTDALSYKVGDLLTVRARANGDCHLTIVAVEADGLATVLFPNDTTTDNRIFRGMPVQVPPATGPFQLRLDKPGRHGISAICNANARRPQGIGHDFERQRFTVLGDWRSFLLETAQREESYQKIQDDLRKFRTGAGIGDALGEQLPIDSEDEARAALSLDVKP